MRTSRLIVATCIVAFSLLAASWIDLGHTNARAVVLDVGQGDAIYVRTPDGQDLLIDSGPASGHVVDRLRAELPRGDNDLELIVSTHLDADHSGGFVDVLSSFDVREVATNGATPTTKTGSAFLAAADAEHAHRRTLHAGQRLSGQGWFADVLWPVVGYRATATNDAGIVLKLQTAHGCILLTADIPDTVEQQLVDQHAPLQCQNLKVAHHGSRTSSSAPFLAAVGARTAVISVGARNSYGHPTHEALDRLRAAGATIHRTDHEGSVTVPL
ncbi:MAG: MBL fold metallo-hydrolase [Candidatus Andersenbacteria bacterium]